MSRRRVIVGVSGASGGAYAIRTLEALKALMALEDVETHLVLTSAARQTIALETDRSVRDVEALASVVHPIGQIAASIASGSFQNPRNDRHSVFHEDAVSDRVLGE